MSSLTTAGTLFAAAGPASFTAPGTLLASTCMSSLTAAGTLLAAVTATEADALAAEAAEAVVLVHAAISIIVGATSPVVCTTTGRALRRFISGLVHVFVTIAHAAVAACRSYPITAE